MRESTSPSKYWLLLLLLIPVVFLLSVTLLESTQFSDAQQPVEELKENWQYRWGESPRDEAGHLVWLTDAPDDPAWQPLDAPSQPPDRQNQRILWLRVQLPAGEWPDATIFLDSVDQGLEAYLDQTLVYRLGQVDRTGNEPALSTIHHLILLPDDFQGKTLTLRMYSRYNTIGPRNGVFIGSRADHILGIIVNDVDRFILAILFIVIGLIALGFFVRRHEQTTYLGLSVFSVSAGVFILFRTQIIELFITSSFIQEYSKLTALYLLPVGLYVFFEQVVSGRWPIVRRMWQIHLLYAVVAIGLSLLGIVQLLNTPLPAAFIFIITLIVVVIISIIESVRGNVEARLFTVGYSLVLLFGSIEYVDEIGLITLPRRAIHWGILGFVLVLAYILLRRFNQVYRQLQAYSHELELKSKELEIKNVALSEMDRLKDEFLANTSHELRTPLNGIIGLAETLLDGAAGTLSEKMSQHLSMIALSGRRLANLVNDILDFSRLKHHEINLELGLVDVRALVDVVITLCKPLVGSKSLQLINDVPADTPFIEADENRVQQILYNLIFNGIKFTESGTVRVSAQTGGNLADERVEITVTDTGIGISPDKIERIFESFEQADGSVAREYGGTGLGLAISRQLLELHGGKIEVSSTINKGSEFTITLPVRQAVTSDTLLLREDTVTPSYLPAAISTVVPVVVQPEEADAVSDSANRNIVIMAVDDEAINLQVLTNQLTLHHYTVVPATSGIEALRLIEQGPQPDLILLDVMMPRMSGYEVCRKLREQYALVELPILMLTAKNQPADILEGFKAGANDYLTKPIDKNELLARVNTLLTLKQAVESHAQLLIIQQELKIAHTIQQNLLPAPRPDWTMPELVCYSNAAREMGGDLYTYHAFDDDSFAVVVGDVSGKGMPAALLMAFSLASLQTIINQPYSPGELLVHLDQVVTFYNQTTLQNCALCYVELTVPQNGSDQRKLRAANAGCIAPVIRRLDGSVEWVDVGGIPLGFGVGVRTGYREASHTLNKGELVILISDGVVEANVHPDIGRGVGEMFGFERFEQAIVSGPATSADAMLSHLRQEVANFIGDTEPHDDLTIVVVQV